MELSFNDWLWLRKALKRLDRKLDAVITQQGVTMSAFDDLVQVVNDVVDAVGKIPPAINTLEARITAILKDVTTPVQLAQVQDAITRLRGVVSTASTAAADAADGIDEAAVIPLGLSYADLASFNLAVAAYNGPEGVTFDDGSGTVDVKVGTSPAFAYFLHSADGHIDTTGPAD